MSDHRRLTRDLAALVLIGAAGILAIAVQPDAADLARLFLTVLHLAAVAVAVFVVAAAVEMGLIAVTAWVCRWRARRRAARRAGYLPIGGPR